MRDTYQYWDMGYTPPKSEDIDPMESDAAMEEYIEQCRSEFHEAWFLYLDEDAM